MRRDPRYRAYVAAKQSRDSRKQLGAEWIVKSDAHVKQSRDSRKFALPPLLAHVFLGWRSNQEIVESDASECGETLATLEKQSRDSRK